MINSVILIPLLMFICEDINLQMGDELDGFWLFDGLEEEPYGLLPLVNLAGKVIYLYYFNRKV